MADADNTNVVTTRLNAPLVCPFCGYIMATINHQEARCENQYCDKYKNVYRLPFFPLVFVRNDKDEENQNPPRSY